MSNLQYSFTKYGQPYIPRDDIPVMVHRSKSRQFLPGEDTDENNPLKISLDKIEKNFGPGTRLYFTFLKFMFFVTCFVGLVAFISWIVFLADPDKTWGFTWADFFVSNYPASTASSRYWFWSNVVIYIIYNLSVPVYFIWEFCIYSEKHPTYQAFNKDIIPENIHKKPRYYIGGVIMLGALMVATGIFYGFLSLQDYVSIRQTSGSGTSNGSGAIIFGFTANTLMGIPVSVSFIVCNMVWNYFSVWITQLENHKRWGTFRFSRSLKITLYKILSATILYLLIALVLTVPPSNQCLLQNSGINFLFTIVIDGLIIVFVETLAPILYRKAKIKWWAADEEDESIKPDFDISEEILQVVYRHFILYLGLMIAPIIGLLGIIVNGIQFYIDRYRIFRVCKKPQYISTKLGTVMLMFVIINVLAVTITYPNGYLWLLFVPDSLPSGFQNCTIVGAIHNL
jgi:hypothetical protein